VPVFDACALFPEFLWPRQRRGNPSTMVAAACDFETHGFLLDAFRVPLLFRRCLRVVYRYHNDTFWETGFSDMQACHLADLLQ
jgi:hypothetical protein